MSRSAAELPDDPAECGGSRRVARKFTPRTLLIEIACDAAVDLAGAQA